MKMQLKSLAAVLGLVTIPMFAGSGMSAGKVSYSDLSVMAAPSTAKEPKKETIEIQSWSLGASNPTSAGYAGHTHVNQGVLNFNATSVPASTMRLCQSHGTLPSLRIESDGQTREFKSVVFQECPAGGSGTFTLTFNGQTTGGIAAAAPAALETPNATIVGLTRASAQINLKRITLATSSATLYVGSANGGVWKTTNGGQTFPSIDIIGKGGTKITFTKVSFGDLVISGAQPDTQTITMRFESTTATPQLVEAILAGR
jgi:hypothetical protein